MRSPMGGAHDRGKFDWLVEFGGAIVPAAAAGFAASKLAPLFSLAPATATAGSSLGMFAVAFATMRSVKSEPRPHPLPVFGVEPIEELGELLLEDRYEEPDDALLLEDVLVQPDPDSRVVRLFAPEAMPTAGQLVARIDRHLAGAPRPLPEPFPVQADASDALYAALAELRRSLR